MPHLPRCASPTSPRPSPRSARVDRDELQPHLFVHYEDRGHRPRLHGRVRVSTRWPSARPRSWARCALARCGPSATATSGTALNALLQQALRVGKRVHTETGIDLGERLARAGRARPGRARARRPRRPVGARRRRRRHGRPRRDHRRPRRAPARSSSPTATTTGAARWPSGSGARPGRCAELRDALADADVVISSTGCRRGSSSRRRRPRRPVAARRPPAGLRRPRAAARRRPRRSPTARRHPRRARRARRGPRRRRLAPPQVAEAADLVTGEVAAYLTARSAEAVAPTVTALRTHAGVLVEEELRAPRARLPGPRRRRARRGAPRRPARRRQAAPHARPSGSRSSRREGQGGGYARALRELFDLDPRDVSLVSAPPPSGSCREDAHDRPCASAPAARALATTQSTLGGRPAARARPRRRARRGDHRGRPSSAAPAAHARRHRGLRLGAPRRRCSPARSTSPCTRSRTCRRRPTRRSTVAAVPTREDPRDALVARDGLTLGELPAGSDRRHRLAAARGPARRARPRPRRSPTCAATSTPGSRLVADGRLRRRRPRRGRAAPPRPDRRGHRAARPAPDAARARARARWPSRCRADDADVVAARRRARRRRHPRLHHRRARRCSPSSRPGCSAPVGALAEVVEGDRRPRAVAARRSSAPPTAPPTCAAPLVGRRRRRRRPRAAASPQLLLEDGAADLDAPRAGPDRRPTDPLPPTHHRHGACHVSPTRSPPHTSPSTTTPARLPQPAASPSSAPAPATPGC